MTIDRANLARTLYRPETMFAFASLTPLLLLSLGAIFGGSWALTGFLSITAFLYLADRLARRLGLSLGESEALGTSLVRGIAVLHFGAMALVLWALSGTHLGFLGWLFTFVGFGLWFGQVANSTAHELIHRTDRLSFGLGMGVYISLLYGHHTSAHRFIHHRYVATPDDPNSAALGESFWDFALRAWPGEFQAGYEIENSMREGGEQQGLGLHPYTIYLAGSAGALVLVMTFFGFGGLLCYLLLCAHTHLQLLLCDYVQHYGLQRAKTGPDSYAPFAPQHSWDAPDLISGLMMLNAPRHSDHHAHPARPYPALTLPPQSGAPLLPASLPVMATIALIPRIWFRIMDPKVRALRRAEF